MAVLARNTDRSVARETQAASTANPTIAQRIAEKLAQRIADDEFEAGRKLREIPLAEEYGVGRSSIREALRILEREGVVSIEPRLGASVKALSTDELIQIYQIRAVLLGLAMSMFAARRRDDDHRWLVSRYREMEALPPAKPDSARRHAAISAGMANLIVRKCGNARLETLFQQMSLQVSRYTRVGLSVEERREESRATWREAVDAIGRGDSEAAERLGRKLVTDLLRFALSRLV